MTSYVSGDRHWRVRVIVLNSRQVIRVEHDTYVMPVGRLALGGRRVGPITVAGGWFLAAEVTDITEVERFVKLTELVEET